MKQLTIKTLQALGISYHEIHNGIKLHGASRQAIAWLEKNCICVYEENYVMAPTFIVEP